VHSADLSGIHRWPSAEARRWVKQFTDNACTSQQIEAVVAVGSAIRTLGHRRSDLDLVVVYSSEPPALDGAPIDVDVRTFKRDQVESLLASGHDLLDWAVRLGAVICEREHYWTELTNRWRDRLAWPSPDIATSRAERTEQLARELLESGDEDAALDLALAMLTHRARAYLLRAGVYPASRPELPQQLRSIGVVQLAEALGRMLEGHISASEMFGERPGAGGTSKAAPATQQER
jgi:HEPN domain-containing protein/predicted nucleotidyltransferase